MKQMIDKATGKVLTRSEAEAKIKDKAGWVITVVAALLAVNTYLGNSNSSKILNSTIEANDTWGFYQAKSIKQSIAEGQLDDALSRKDASKVEKLRAKIARYESDPEKGEGKKELMAKAQKLAVDRADAKKRSPWYTFAGTAFQLAIVLLSASILAVSMSMFWASLGVGTVGAILMAQAIWMIV
jgi:hypothetical protein